VAYEYKMIIFRRVINFLVTALLLVGLAPKRYYRLTVRGHKSGRLYSTPVIVINEKGHRWLVCPYGERQWVKNARAAGRVILTRGRNSEDVPIEEVRDPAQSAQILQQYIADVPITRKYFGVTPGSPLEEFANEAHLHPVFRIVDNLTV
jgi:deazaflavin-dependent oxidoreductase (nitroreductase family)